MKTRTLLLLVLIPVFTTLSACGSWWLPRPHKIDIQQGNLLSPDAVAKIEEGMSKAEVTAILGQPLTSNQINPERWEYIYSINRSGDKPKVQRISLEFENDRVAVLEKDGLPES